LSPTFRETLATFFNLYGHQEIFRHIFPSPKAALFRFHRQQCAIDTHGSDDFISRALLSGQVWEPRVAELVRGLCQQGGTFLDVGCNVGAHLAVAVLSGASRVIGFECNPTTLACLDNTVLRWNGWADRVTVFPVGASDAEGTLPLVQTQGNVGASHLRREGGKNTLGCVVSGVVSVPVQPLDAIETLRRELPEPIVLKMDVEGSEAAALRGMPQLLKRVQTLIIELNPHTTTPEAFSSMLATLYLEFPVCRVVFDARRDAWAGGALDSLVLPAPIAQNTLLAHLGQHTEPLEVVFTR